MKARWGIFLFLLLLPVAAADAATHQVPAAYATIQAAVDAAAPGDTVAVDAGTWEEQVVIPVPIVLRGAGRDLTVINAPVDLPHAEGADAWRAVVTVTETADGARIEDLAIDGLGRGPATGRFVGLLFHRAGGAGAGLNIDGVHQTPPSPVASGVGVVATLDGLMAPRNLLLSDIAVRRFQKSGVAVSGAGYSAVLDSVVIDATGLATDAVQNGFDLSRVGSARIGGGRIDGVVYDGSPRPEYTACGLVAVNCPDLVVDGLEVGGSQTGIYLVHSPATVTGCRVDTPQPGSTTAWGIVSVNAVNVAAAGGTDAIPAPQSLFGAAATDARPPVGFDVTLADCVLDGGGTPSSRGLGIRAYTAEGQWLTADRCRLENWECGVLSLEDPRYFGAVYGRLNGCTITGNGEHGIKAVTVSPMDARGCRWTDASGPFHPDTNPAGMGDKVSDQVRYDPWLTGNLAPLPLPQAISLADGNGMAFTDSVVVQYLGGGDDLLYGFSLALDWDAAVVTAVSVEQPASGAFADAAIYFVSPGAGGASVDAALGGDHPGMASGPLCVLRFQAVGTPDWTASPVNVTLNHVRNNANQPITGIATDHGRIIVDLQPPVVSSVTLVNETLDFTDAYAKDGDLVSVTAVITDGDPDFGRGGVRGIGAFVYGAPSLILPPDSYQDSLAVWNPRPALMSPSEGLRPFSVEAIDLAGNASSPLVTATIIADNTPPAAVTGLTATGAHNRVDVSWDDATTNDLNYRRTVVRANPWGDYPVYADPEPGYPADPADGVAVASGDTTDATLLFPADGSERDILYVGAMVEDMAGNLGPVVDGARARVINYRLGDVAGAAPGTPGDGLVGIIDMSRLGDTYALAAGDAGFDPACDLAPVGRDTTGIPEPDGAVDFDDLMIFASNFEIIPPAGTRTDPAAPAVLRWVPLADRTWSLVLVDPSPTLKGVRLAVDAGVAMTASVGSLVAAQDAPWFLHEGRADGEFHLAVLGRGVGLDGAGEILRLTADQPFTPTATELELRDTANADLPGQIDGSPTAAPDTPVAFRAAPPAPNPFNPSTTIAFELPAGQDVRLAIYGLDGRRVRSLLQTALPAGRHATRWDGRDDRGRTVASGMYLYRLEAGPWSASGKLELVK